MTKSNRTRICAAVFSCALVAFVAVSCSKGARSARHPIEFFREHNLKRLPRFDVPIEVNDRVIAWMEYFTGAGRNHFGRYLERSGRYIPHMRAELAKRGVPRDLVYVALIESGFNNHAHSRANAVGTWQFIRSTGRRYGLRIDSWVDERKDPIEATKAAAAFLKDLHDEFGDWYLAMAAYNGGPGRVRKAIEMTGSRDFWRVAGHHRAFRAETRDYVPKFIAAAIMAKMPERFGFGDVRYEDELSFEHGTVETQTDLGVVAKCAGVKLSDVAELNPQLVAGATPPRARDYTIRLPNGSAETFRRRYAELPKSERIRVVRYRVRSGDTLSRIARRYGISVHSLASANNIRARSYRRLRHGRTLIIPAGGRAARYARAEDAGSGSRTSKVIRHRVVQGETAGQIANLYGVSVSSLKSWNNLDRRATIRAGQTLKIYERMESGSRERRRAHVAAGDGTYTVSSGETIGGIAGRLGVSAEKLMEWNHIRNPRRVRAGAKLVVRAPTPREAATTAIALADIKNTAPPEAISPRGSSVQEHRVMPGETLGHIAERYGVSARMLMKWNKIRNPRRVRAGSTLVIHGGSTASKPEAVVEGPAAGGASSESKETGGTPAELASAPSAAGVSESSAPDRRVITYRVKTGDTLWNIARRHKVTIAQIQEWNDLADPSSVHPGTKLIIHK